MAEGGQDLAFDFMKILLATGTGNCWPHFTNLIVVIKTEDGEVIWKKKYQTSYGHTEIQMLSDKEFKDEVEKVKADKTKKVVIILTSNYSPCRECADKLKEFYELEIKKSLIEEFIITIRFSRLYRINEQDNKNGLKDLYIKGITLEAMTEKSWLDVLITEESWSDSMTVGKSSIEKMMKEEDWFDQVMKLFGLDPDKVRKRDEATSKRLEQLVMEALADQVKKNLRQF